MWEKLTTAIQAILPITGGDKKIQSFYTYEASNLEGTPAAVLIPSANESEYATTTENERVYAFKLLLFVERESGNANEQTAENALRDLVDSVIDDLDANDQLSVEAQTGYTFLYMEAAPSQWGYADSDGIKRVAEINIRVHYHVDTTAIS